MFVLELHETSVLLQISKVFIVNYHTVHAVLALCYEYMFHHIIIMKSLEYASPFIYI